MAQGIARIEAVLASRKVVLARAMAASTVAKDCGASSTGALIAGDFGHDRAAGDRLVRTAQNLQSATVTERALDAGDISLDQAAVISGAVAGLPGTLSEHARLRVEKGLIADAKIFSLRDLRRRVLRVADLYAPKPDADADENDRLVAREARAWQACEFWISPARDGQVRGGFTIPEAQAEMLKNCLDAVAAPRRRHLEFNPAEDELSNSQQFGRAFCTWIEHLPTDGFPVTGGTPATVTVNLDFQSLRDQLTAAGTISTGTRISAGEARRLACTAGILPKVLDGQSLPLDLGRAKRLFSPAQRLVLAERDLGCTYPGCDRPPGWCETHHLRRWATGGRTDVDNGALLCPFHHHYLHDQDIRTRKRGDWIEYQLDGIWQRNHRWRT